MNIHSFDVVGFADDELVAEERPFDPWRTPCTSKAETFVKNFIKMLEDHEALFGARKRKRRAADQLRFERMLSALACDLALIVLTEGSKAIYISRSHQELIGSSRYGNPASSKTLPAILDRLATQQVDLISMTLGFQKHTGEGKKTTIRPSNKFRRLVRDYALSTSDIAECERPEPIELKASPTSQSKKAQRIDYKDTAQTHQFRQQMQEINSHLLTARIDYTGQAKVDINRRQLRRIFTRERFDSGGRLFGGFWQPMGKTERLQHIKINGEEVVELDYGQIMPRLVYADACRVPPVKDLYSIQSFEERRDGVKKVMSAMLFVVQPLRRFPQGTRKLFRRKTHVQDVTTAIMAAHPEIADKFFTGIGHRCQYRESQIMVEVLRILNANGITALPIHDAILVPASASTFAQRVMLFTFKRLTRIEGEVSILTAQQHPVEDHPLAA